MNSVITELKLNVNRIKPIQRIFAKQFDRNTRILKVSLFDGIDPYSLEGISRACIRGEKPDKTQVFNDCVIEDDYILATLSEQMLAAKGTVMADIVLFADGDDSPILSSEGFYIDVFPACFDDEQAESESEYSAIIDALVNAPNKGDIWKGFADYFNSLEGVPEEAVEEFENVDLETMTFDLVVKEIFIINKMILDAHLGGGVTDVLLNGESTVTDGVANIGAVTEVFVNNQRVDVGGVADITIPTPNIPIEDVKVNDSSVVDNKIANVIVPTDLSDLTEDSSHRTVTDAEKAEWNSKADVSDIPDNYVTTNTEQTITGNKTLVQGNHSIEPLHTDNGKTGARHRVEDGEHYAEAKFYLDLIGFDEETGLTNEPYLTLSYNVPVIDEHGEVLEYYDCVDKIKIPLREDDGSQIPEILTSFSNISADGIYETNAKKFVTPSEKSTWNGKYSKPNSGIPKSDLSSTVQTSLEKADTAIQTHQDISGKADIADIPTKTSDLQNDSGFLTSHQDLTNYVTTDTNQDNITGRKGWIYNNKPVIIIDPSYHSSVYGSMHACIQINNPTATDATQYRYGEIVHSGCTLALPSSTSGTFALLSDIPTNNNQLTNGAGYQTASDVSTAIANNQFIATYSKNVNDEWECDKTFAEIETAIQNKKEMIALVYETVQGSIFVRQYTISAHVIGSSIVWVNIDKNGQLSNGTFVVNLIGHLLSDAVFVNTSSFDFTLKEDVANKVALIDASSPSNINYPTEEAVINYIKDLKGKMETPAPEKIYYTKEDTEEDTEIDITSDLVGDTPTYRIDSNGSKVSYNYNYCFKCDLSQYAPTKINTASRSTSWYSYAFYSSNTTFDDTTFISGGHNTKTSLNASPVYEELIVDNIPDNAITMLVTCYYEDSEFKVYGYEKNQQDETISYCVNRWIEDDKPNAFIFKQKEIPTHMYRVGANRTYTTLISAVNQWNLDDKPCAIIYVDKGTYITSSDPEGVSNALTIKGGKHRLTIIGEDKNTTIIKSTTGKYIHPAINIQGGNVAVKNLTFIADHSTNANFTYLDPDREAQGKDPNSAYAVHCDGGNTSGVVTNGLIEFENCNMWSWQSCGLGCGTVENGHVVVKKCDIRSFVPGTATDDQIDPEKHAIYVHGSRGAIVYHTTSSSNNSNESFTLIDSTVYLKGGIKTAKITCSDDGYKMVTFINNVFYNEIESCNSIPLSLAHHLNSISTGNNFSNLNSDNCNNYLNIINEIDEQYLYETSDKEDIANKVTLIDSTSPSINKYPTESAVVTYMNNVVGDIETLLAEV